MNINEIENIKDDKVKLTNFLIDLFNKVVEKNTEIQAFVNDTLNRENLLKQIDDLFAKFPDKAQRPELFGVPIGIKDIFKVDGFPTRCGSNLPTELFEGKEAEVVTKLRNEGCIIFGKTHTTEFAYFEPSPTRNPKNLEYTPGGSSSGSAAAVAAKFLPLTLGTQTIGSVTRPASFCGVYGYKPTYNRVSKQGVIPFAESVDHVGLFANNITDIRLVASKIYENWKTNNNFSKPVIGLVSGNYLKQASPEVLNCFTKYVKTLKASGLKIVEIDLFGDIEPINKMHYDLCAYEMAETHKNWFE